MVWYCTLARGHPVHGPFHDTEHGFPVTEDSALLERLTLEVFQAGLSWEIVLKKRAALRAALADLDPDALAAFGPSDIERLMANPALIRNRRKLEATVVNAQRVVGLRGEHGGFAGWLRAAGPLDLPAWLKRFRGVFVFVGPEIVGEFLMGVGLIPGAHAPSCPVYPAAEDARRRVWSKLKKPARNHKTVQKGNGHKGRDDSAEAIEG